MIIDSLEKMEELVNNNPNLKWDGWNVEYYDSSEDGFMKLNGVYLPDGWGTKQVFKLENGVWNIPDNILRKKT